MKPNKLLSLSLVACWLIQLLQAGIILFLIWNLVEWHLEPEEFTGIKFSSLTGFNFSLTQAFYYSGHIDHPHLSFFINDMHPFSLYLICLQLTGLLVLIMLVIQEFITIIKSVQQVQSFRSQNVKAFRKMALYFLLMFFISGFTFVVVGQSAYFRTFFNAVPLVLMLACFILAEVFKEGNRLHQEEQLTI